MDYCTQEDLVTRFGADEIAALSNVEPSGGIDSGRVAQVISDVSAVIDGYLVSRYTLPLPSLPANLTVMACDMVRYRLARLPTDEMGRRNTAAVSYLRDVSQGKSSLGVDDAGAAPAASGGPAAFSGGRTFSKEGLRDYRNPDDWRGGAR